MSLLRNTRGFMYSLRLRSIDFLRIDLFLGKINITRLTLVVNDEGGGSLNTVVCNIANIYVLRYIYIYICNLNTLRDNDDIDKNNSVNDTIICLILLLLFCVARFSRVGVYQGKTKTRIFYSNPSSNRPVIVFTMLLSLVHTPDIMAIVSVAFVFVYLATGKHFVVQLRHVCFS